MSRREIRKELLILGLDYKVAVGIYAPVREAKRPPPVELEDSSRKIVLKMRSNTSEPVGQNFEA